MDWMIHKYSLHDAMLDATITIPIPAGAQVLCVKTQTTSSATRIHAQGATLAVREVPMLWAQFPQESVMPEHAHFISRTFLIAATGIPFENPEGKVLRYIDTFFLNGGQFVGHAYEVLNG